MSQQQANASFSAETITELLKPENNPIQCKHTAEFVLVSKTGNSTKPFQLFILCNECEQLPQFRKSIVSKEILE